MAIPERKLHRNAKYFLGTGAAFEPASEASYTTAVLGLMQNLIEEGIVEIVKIDEQTSYLRYTRWN